MNEKMENLLINEIFKSREKFIPEVGKQLEKPQRVKIEIDNGKTIEVDYRVISVVEKENKEADPVLLLPGFGSGWEGISELGFSLTCEGRQVIMLSLPGYGNSENPPKEYYATDSFENEAEAINDFLEKINLENKKVHLIDHSMGSVILASLAAKHPEKVSSLVLLNPAGVEKENPLKLSSKFVFSGIQTSAEFQLKTFFSGEKDYEDKLKKYIPKTISPFEKDRLKQRLAEAKKVSKAHLLEKLEKIQAPVTYISGELDTVYPSGKMDNENSQLTKIIKSVNINSRMEISVMAGLRHNTTIAPDEITTANLEHYLEAAEK